jgi:succinate dehydrogenase / fumarate reductase, membrane anchor subunit
MSVNHRTPLGRVRGLGSAKSGTQHWWMQRVTAVANVPLVLFAIYFVIAHLGATRDQVVQAADNPFTSLLLALGFVAVLWHMKLGMQVIIEDYVTGHFAKIVAIILNGFYTVALGAAAIYAILKMNFGL